MPSARMTSAVLPARSCMWIGPGRGLPGHPFCPSDPDLDHVCTKVYARGFRNPFRFSPPHHGGTPIVGDVGSGRARRWIWSRPGRTTDGRATRGRSGLRSTPTDARCAPEYAKEGTTEAASAPIYDYSHEGGFAAVMGGPVFTGAGFPRSHRGSVFFGDYVKGTIDRLRLSRTNAFTGVRPFGRSLGALVDLEFAPAVVLSTSIPTSASYERFGLPAQSVQARTAKPVSGCLAVWAITPGVASRLTLWCRGRSQRGRDHPGRPPLYTAALGAGTEPFSRSGSGTFHFNACIGQVVPGCASIAPVRALKERTNPFSAQTSARCIRRLRRATRWSNSTAIPRRASCGSSQHVSDKARWAVPVWIDRRSSGAHTILVSGNGRAYIPPSGVMLSRISGASRAVHCSSFAASPTAPRAHAAESDECDR